MPVIDLMSGTAPDLFETDLCVIGSGPAGLSIAGQFAATSTRICVIESGGLEREEDVEALNTIESVGLRRAPQELTRCRGFGGTSQLWSGRCGEFDEIDYQRRPWIPFSGWPISYADMAPYIERAGRILGLGPALYSDRALATLLRDEREPEWDPQYLLPVVWQFSQHGAATGHPVRAYAQRGDRRAENIGALQHAGAPRPIQLGEALLPMLRDSENIQVLLHATATSIETDETGTRVRSVALSSPDGKERRVVAGKVVLACGGIENARLLLASRSVDPRGVGNARDTVGRFLMDHSYVEIAAYEGPGSAALRRRLGHRWLIRNGSRHVFAQGVRLSPELQRREQLLNCALHVAEFGARPSSISLARRAARSLRAGQVTKEVAVDLLGAVRNPLELGLQLRERYLLQRPSLSSPDRVSFGCVVEQQPGRESRVTLSDRRDALGMNLPKIDWRASDLEFETARRMSQVVMAEFARLGYVAPTPALWLQGGLGAYRDLILDASHPIGATRMSSDPSCGVVDANCEVHGVAGLYVAGSSVFSTSGYMNPTQMIVALSFRLADHLKAGFQLSAPRVGAAVAQPAAGADRRARIGIVGAGDRIQRIYLPVLTSLAGQFELVGVTTRSAESARRFSEMTGARSFAEPEAMAREAEPDFIIGAVSTDVIDTVVPRLVDLGVPLLLETPFAWSVRKGRRTIERIRATELLVGVAEQTPMLPLEQLKRKLIQLGLLGRIVAVHNDFAIYGYHGVGALRAYHNSPRRAVRVNAVRAQFPPAGAAVPQPMPAGDRTSETWVQGVVTYDDGSILVHHYSDEYFDSPLREPRSVRIYGTSGTMIGDVIRIEGENGQPLKAAVQRSVHSGRLQALSVDTPMGEVCWRNPFAEHPFNDEQIAVASLLSQMRIAALFQGVPFYTAESALEDMEILAAMRFSWLRKGAPVRMPLKQGVERARSAVAARVG